MNKVQKEQSKAKTIEDQFKIMNKYQPLIAKKFKNEKIIQVKNNKGVIFFTSNDKIAGLHSEPKQTTPRLFISILPGSKENIEELNKRWSK